MRLPSSGVGGGAFSQRTVGVIGACGHGSGEGVDVYLGVIGNFRAARKLMRGTIRDDLNPLALSTSAGLMDNTTHVPEGP
jgi:hypothetical protein